MSGTAFRAGRFDIQRVQAALMEAGRPDLAESCEPCNMNGEVVGMAYGVMLIPDDLKLVEKAIAVTHALDSPETP